MFHPRQNQERSDAFSREQSKSVRGSRFADVVLQRLAANSFHLEEINRNDEGYPEDDIEGFAYEVALKMLVNVYDVFYTRQLITRGRLEYRKRPLPYGLAEPPCTFGRWPRMVSSR